MYNLLITSEAGAWNKPSYKFDRSRFLEYTNEEVAEKFEGLSPKQIEDLKSLPCLFAYEVWADKPRLGRITEIKQLGRYIEIHYEFFEGLLALPIEKVKPLAASLDIREWEMNRTHWAVKDEDLLDILSIDTPLSTLIPNIGSSDRPQETVAPIEISSVQEFIGKILQTQSTDEYEVFYRGHWGFRHKGT